jgi:hypothetical protein
MVRTADCRRCTETPATPSKDTDVNPIRHMQVFICAAAKLLD